MHEVADIGPVVFVAVVQPDGGPQALAHHLQPERADLVGRQLALAPGVVEAGLELVEGDLAHHAVEAILDLAGQQRLAVGGRGLGQQPLEHQSLAEDRGGLGQGQRRVGQQGAERAAQGLVHRVPQLVGQGQHVTSLAHVVHEHIGVPGRRDRVAIGAGLLAGPRAGVDPGLGEEGSGLVGELRGQGLEALQHHGLGLPPVVGARRGGIERGVAVPVVEGLAAHGLRLGGIIAMAGRGVAFDHRLGHGVHRLGVDLVGDVPRLGRVVVPAPAILDLLFEGQGVHHQGHGRGAVVQRLGQPVGGLLAARRRRVGQPVQRLGQGQVLAAGLGRKLRQGLVIEPAPVGDGRGAIDQQPLQIGRQLVRPAQPQPAHPGRPAAGQRMGGERRLDLAVLQLVQLQREEQAVGGDLRRPGPQVALELGPGRVVARRGGGQRGVSPHRPQAVGRLLVQVQALVDQCAQRRRVGAAFDEPAFERDQRVIGLFGLGQIQVDARIAATGVKVGQVPLGQVGWGGGLGMGVHGLGYAL